MSMVGMTLFDTTETNQYHMLNAKGGFERERESVVMGMIQKT